MFLVDCCIVLASNVLVVTINLGIVFLNIIFSQNFLKNIYILFILFSIANYYETEAGAYCCEMCPDEEVIQSEVAESNKIIVIQTDLNDIADDADEEDSLPESMQKQKVWN